MDKGKEKTTFNNDDSGISGMSSSTSETQPEVVIISQDGGWGWMVCIGSFVTNFVLDGTMFSFGVLLLDLLSSFGETKSKTSWVGSALVGMSMMMGPFVSLLLKKYTIRTVTVMGAFVASGGFIISIFSPNIELLILTYGVIGGIGFCMMFIPAIIVVGVYFDKRRALATGIATSGSGLGTFAYAYLTDVLLDEYGWRGTVLILAGILLHVVVCGLIFRPLVTKTFKSNKCQLPSTYLSKRQKDEDYFQAESFLNSPGSIFEPDNKIDLTMHSVPVGLNMLQQQNIGKTSSITDTKYVTDVRKYSSSININTAYESQLITRYLKPMLRKDVFYSGSVNNIQDLQQSRDLNSANVSLTELESRNNEERDPQKPCCVFRQGDLISLGLFRNSTFVLLMICMVMWTAQIVCLTYIPDMALSKGIPRVQCALLISIVGIANIAGRLVSGFITDCLRIRSINVYAVSLITAAAINFSLPFCESFYLLATCCGIFGLCMASSVSLRTIVLADLLGIENLTQSFGLIALFQGIAFIINPPLAGYLFDKTQSYTYPFLLVGCMYLVSGSVCLPLMCKHKHSSDVTIHVSKTNISNDSLLIQDAVSVTGKPRN